MNLIHLFILAFGLSIDTMIAAFSQGSFVHAKHLREAFKISLSFALFQGTMPIFGWVLAQHFYELLKDIDHWIAFLLFIYLGGKLIHDALLAYERKSYLTISKILLLSIATSVDSLVAGATLSFINSSIMVPAIFVGSVTFISSLGGFWLGNKSKHLNPKFMEIMGGSLLIFLGCKILWEHLSA